MLQIEEIEARFHSIASDLGYELVELTGLSLGGRSVIRVYIYKPGGVTIRDCKALSNAFSDYLDIENPIKGKYTLEVSSPGLDRPLKEIGDYRRCVGETVQVELKSDSNPEPVVEGKITETDETGVSLLIKNEKLRLDFDTIIRGKIVY